MPHVQHFTDEQRALGAARRIGVTIEAYRAAQARGEKWCCGCRGFVHRDEFGGNRTSRDGLASMCRPCKQAYDRAYRAHLLAARRTA